MKLLPSRRTFCVHHAIMHLFTVSLHAKLIRMGCVCVCCNLPPARLAEWPGSFTCYCGNTVVERILKKSAQQADLGQKIYKLQHRLCRYWILRPLDQESDALTTKFRVDVTDMALRDGQYDGHVLEDGQYDGRVLEGWTVCWTCP